MGNNLEASTVIQDNYNPKRRQTELGHSDSNEEQAFQEEQQKQTVCLCCIKAKTVKRKVTWQHRFILNCEQLKTDLGFQWIEGLIEIVRNNQLNKVKFVKEVHNLRKEKPQNSKIAGPQILSQPEQVERFKKNLKRSVIISFTQNPKSVNQLQTSSITASFMMKRSRLEHDQAKKQEFKSGLNMEKKKKELAKIEKFSDFSRSNSHQSQSPSKEVPKQTATQLQIFLKFSSILQRHLSETNCILGCLRKQFIDFFLQKFQESASSSQQLDHIIETVQIFITILNAGVMDYYNLRLFSRDEVGSNIFISNEQNISSSCTAILFRDHQFYNCLFSCISYSFKEREQKFSNILSYLHGSGPERFQVKDKYCLNARTMKTYLKHLSSQSEQANVVENIEINDIVVQHSQPYKRCMLNLNQMVKSRSPINKLKCLMACSQGITIQIQKFYDMNSLRKQKWMLDADQMLSIFCYLLVGAKIEHLHTHLFLLDNFASSLQMISMTGYYLSVMQCAVQQLENQFGREIDRQGEIGEKSREIDKGGQE